MPFTVKKRGKLTYYFKGERPVLSSLVTEELPDGDLKISFAGLTGGYSAKNVLEAQFDFHVPFSPWTQKIRTAAWLPFLHPADRHGWSSRSKMGIHMPTRTRCASRSLAERSWTHGSRRRCRALTP